MYHQVTVVIDGAVDEEIEFESYLNLDMFLNRVARASTPEQPAYVYILEHDHPIHEECECAQYVTDHNPTHIYRGPLA